MGGIYNLFLCRYTYRLHVTKRANIILNIRADYEYRPMYDQISSQNESEF